MITLVERITPEQARDTLQVSDAMLVCAYNAPSKVEEFFLPGAISLEEFRAKDNWIPKEREIIFYCSCPHEETSTRVAEEYKAAGFVNAKVLQGGYEAARAAGFDTDAAAT